MLAAPSPTDREDPMRANGDAASSQTIEFEDMETCNRMVFIKSRSPQMAEVVDGLVNEEPKVRIYEESDPYGMEVDPKEALGGFWIKEGDMPLLQEIVDEVNCKAAIDPSVNEIRRHLLLNGFRGGVGWCVLKEDDGFCYVYDTGLNTYNDYMLACRHVDLLPDGSGIIYDCADASLDYLRSLELADEADFESVGKLVQAHDRPYDEIDEDYAPHSEIWDMCRDAVCEELEDHGMPIGSEEMDRLCDDLATSIARKLEGNLVMAYEDDEDFRPDVEIPEIAACELDCLNDFDPMPKRTSVEDPNARREEAKTVARMAGNVGKSDMGIKR